MSTPTPEPRRDPLPQPRPRRAVTPTAGPQRTLTGRTLSWIGWHLGELAGVGVPLILAATVTEWFAALSALWGLLWAAHEYRTRHITTPTAGTDTQGRDAS